MRAAIVANGRQPPSRELLRVLRQADLVVCADGGLRVVRRLGVTPHVVIGDFDSASPSLLAWARSRGARLVHYPREKDKTDAELAAEYALRARANPIDLVGVLGGRIDHALANVGLLVALARRRRRARILHGKAELFLATSRSTIPGRVGERVSLIPASPIVSGVTTQGLKYPLANARLRIDSTRGVSNEITSVPARVRVRGGWLLVVTEHRH